MFNYKITIAKTKKIKNKYNQEIKKIGELKKVFAIKKSISRNEFYFSKNSGYNPSIIFLINDFEYDNEDVLYYDNFKYKIIKTFIKESEKLIELTCEIDNECD